MALSPRAHEKLIESMGKRVAADLSLSAAEDQDPAAVRYFQRFEQQFLQMEAGSLSFTQTISKTNRDKLLKIRSDYFDVLKALAAEKKKGVRADRHKLEELVASRRILLAAIPLFLTEWISAINSKIDEEFKKHPEMTKLRPPSDISADLSAKEAEIKQAKKDVARDQAAAGKAMSEFETESRTSLKAEAGPLHVPGSAKFKKALEASEAAQQKFRDKLRALESATNQEINARQRLSTTTSTRDALAAELKSSDTSKLHDFWRWIAMLRELRQALNSPDLTTDAGVRAFERLTTGDLTELGSNAQPENPPLLRLLEAGFFNPKGAFDLAFFEEMAHSGFMPGAAWEFGGADPMHFELIEGRLSIIEPGK
jgi:hypothetical protein